MVKVGTPVKIIYEPVLLAHLDDGSIFVEANPDIYGLAPNAIKDLRALADSSHISNMIDWQRVREALERKDGSARDPTMPVATPVLSMSSISPILNLAFRPRVRAVAKDRRKSASCHEIRRALRNARTC
jgi:hypothetical protein